MGDSHQSDKIAKSYDHPNKRCAREQNDEVCGYDAHVNGKYLLQYTHKSIDFDKYHTIKRVPHNFTICDT